ncbi:MAG: fluoride efflux transporter CrcB [Gammaproteobacteria bacterium]|nr:fluoride efflux transporter CrcB [Gammaproteobacteria bacterium]
MKQVLAIAAGGALGSALRFWMSTWVHGIAGRGFPYGTLTVNVLGSFVMGLLCVLLIDKFNVSLEWRAALLTGVLGGFTTFSSFSMETLTLFEMGEPFKASLYILLSIAVCLAATWVGMVVARQIPL